MFLPRRIQVNFWIPLQSPHVRPLAVMDQRRTRPADFLKIRWFPQLKSDESKNFTSDLFSLRRPPSSSSSGDEDDDKDEPRIFFNPYMTPMESAVVFSTTHAFHSGVALGGDETLVRGKRRAVSPVIS